MRLNYYKQPFGFGLQTPFIDHLKTALIKLILFFALALFYTNIKNDVIIGTQSGSALFLKCASCLILNLMFQDD